MELVNKIAFQIYACMKRDPEVKDKPYKWWATRSDQKKMTDKIEQARLEAAERNPDHGKWTTLQISFIEQQIHHYFEIGKVM